MGQKLTDRPSDYTFGKRKLRWPWLIVAGVGALILIGLGGYLTFRGSAKKNMLETDTNAAANIPAQANRRLDGVLVDGAKANFLPLAIMIENHSSVRPQSGLSKAGVVYEALAEGGITRFLAIFATNGDVTIGPVRSARPYFVQLAREYSGLYVHAGASPQGTEAIKSTGILDFNQFYKPYNFYRLKNSGRPLEHTLFTDLHRMELGRQALNLKDEGIYTPWSFKDDTPTTSTGALKPIVIDFSTPSYRASFAYTASTNSYIRSQGGTVQTDKNDNTKIAPKNVVIMYTTSTLFDKLRRNILVVGEGKLLLFRDGQTVIGTWKKASADARLQLLDSNGSALQLNRGQTWIEVVDLAEKYVTY